MARILAQLQGQQGAPRGRVSVGLLPADDAAVVVMPDGPSSLVATLDFFPPIVDDPYDYGAISAANAMSDIYAMGGEVVFALNICAFPEDLPSESVAEILRGGMDTVNEAGAEVVGGHTILDDVPKYGLVAVGTVERGQVLTKGAARPGDLLYLTKPIGTGVVTSAAMQGYADDAHVESAVSVMKTLNRSAARAVRKAGVVAATDVTGFGLLGHGYEVASSSDARLNISSSAVPLLPGARDYAEAQIQTSGAARCRTFLDAKVRIQDDVQRHLGDLMYDPQTSGGLLFAAGLNRRYDIEEEFKSQGLELHCIGEVLEGEGVEVGS